MNKPQVEITSINKLGEDERGDTFDFSLPNPRQDFILVRRKAGTISGNSYHLGESPNTNPKVFVLVSGKIIFSWRGIEEGEAQKAELSEPSIITVFPQTTHAVKVLEDAIFLEGNSIADIKDDRFFMDV